MPVPLMKTQDSYNRGIQQIVEKPTVRSQILILIPRLLEGAPNISRKTALSYFLGAPVISLVSQISFVETPVNTFLILFAFLDYWWNTQQINIVSFSLSSYQHCMVIIFDIHFYLHFLFLWRNQKSNNFVSLK